VWPDEFAKKCFVKINAQLLPWEKVRRNSCTTLLINVQIKCEKYLCVLAVGGCVGKKNFFISS
jgi:hypothetical protein